MHKIVKILETIKFHDLDPSRIEKIEEIIDTLGTTLSSIKTKKVETLAKKEPRFVYVPKAPRFKNNTSTTKGVETMKTLEEIPLFNRINETPIDLPPFAFIPRSIFIRPLFERPLKNSCTIEEIFDDLDDGSTYTT